MIRKLTAAIAIVVVGTTLFVAAAVKPASALDQSLPYADGIDCQAMAGPIYAPELTYYVFAYRTNGGTWTYSRWHATYGVHNWEYYYGYWANRQVNLFFASEPNVGDRIDRWAYVVRNSFTGWVNLGSCTKGGLVFSYG